MDEITGSSGRGLTTYAVIKTLPFVTSSPLCVVKILMPRVDYPTSLTLAPTRYSYFI
jgi:hypothetical protein